MANTSFFSRPLARRERRHPDTEHDRLIAENLAWQLEHEVPTAHDLRFLVHHGTVILQGHLGDHALRSRIMTEAARVTGVRRVIDRMTPPVEQKRTAA